MNHETPVNSMDVIAQLSVADLDPERDLVSACIKKAMEKYFAQLQTHTVTGLYQLVLAEVEKPLLESVLEYTDRNQSKAADVLGISRSTLRKKLNQYEIELN